MVCEKCNTELTIGSYPFCPHGRGASTVRGDEIDEVIEHGICWPDGSPRQFTSRAEKQRALTEAGFVEAVRHVGEPGSDKSEHTVRWTCAPTINEEDRITHWYATADPELAAVAREHQ